MCFISNWSAVTKICDVSVIKGKCPKENQLGFHLLLPKRVNKKQAARWTLNDYARTTSVTSLQSQLNW